MSKMTESMPPFSAEGDSRYTPEPTEGRTGDAVPPTGAPLARLPFSKAAIWGFALSCLRLLVFGFVGALGASISARGFHAARRGAARGRGLAIAGIIIGTVGFLYYAVNFVVAHLS
jgi:hypothetical protein